VETEENRPMTEREAGREITTWLSGQSLVLVRVFEKASQSFYLFFSSTRRSNVKTIIIWALTADKIVEASQKNNKLVNHSI
jgi:hypothetical protein